MTGKYTKNNLAALAVAAVLLTVYALALFGAEIRRASVVLWPLAEEYVEDINGDGRMDGGDALALLDIGMRLPGSPKADYNKDNTFNILDVVGLLVNIKNGRLTPVTPPDTSDTTGTDTTGSDTTGTDTTGTDTTSQEIYKVSGVVYCLSGGVGGVKVVIESEDLQQSTFTQDGSGMYYFEVPGDIYTIYPEAVAGYGFTPSSMTVRIQTDAPNMDFLIYGYESIGSRLPDAVYEQGP